MDWEPPTKRVSDIKTVAIAQKLKGARKTIALFDCLSFVRYELLMSAARTRLLRLPLRRLPDDERQALMEEFGHQAAARFSFFLGNGAEFSFTSRVDYLADDELTALASQVGTAVTDLTMERLGFHFRANARELRLKLRKPAGKDLRRPDFVYDPGEANGYEHGTVAVVESKGSLSKLRARRQRLGKAAENAYKGQVHHFIGATGDGLTVAAGFAVAFGAVPESQESSLAIASPHAFSFADDPIFAHPVGAAATASSQPAFQQQEIQEEETSVEAQEQRRYYERTMILGGGGGGRRGGGRRREARRLPSGRIAFANYEVVFGLCGAWNVASLLRRILSGRSVEEDELGDFVQEFQVVERDGRFLVGHGNYGPFAIYEPSARNILKL